MAAAQQHLMDLWEWLPYPRDIDLETEYDYYAVPYIHTDLPVPYVRLCRTDCPHFVVRASVVDDARGGYIFQLIERFVITGYNEQHVHATMRVSFDNRSYRSVLNKLYAIHVAWVNAHYPPDERAGPGRA